MDLKLFIKTLSRDQICELRELLKHEPRVPIADEILQMKISDVKGFSTRTKHALAAMDIVLIQDFATMKVGDLFRYRNIGTQSIKNIKQTLESLGIKVPEIYRESKFYII